MSNNKINWGGYKPNNIYNVDCYKAIKEIPDKSIDCIYVDVPYLIGSKSKKENKTNTGTRLNQRIKKIENEFLNANIYAGFDYSLLEEFIRISKNFNCFIWCSKEQIPHILKFYTEKGYKYNLLVWCKTNPTPATRNTWLPDVEYCLYFRDSHVLLNDGYEYKSKWFLSGTNKQDKDLFEHPTIKPIEIVKRHLLHATKEGDVVFDCFLGSGTTAVACQQINRQYIGFEILEKFYNIAIDRLNGLSVQDRKEKDAGQLSLFDF